MSELKTMDSEKVMDVPMGILSAGKSSAGKVLSGVGSFYKYAWYTALGSALTLEENVAEFSKKMAAKGEKVELKAKTKITQKFDFPKAKLTSASEDIKSKAHEKMEDVEQIIDKGVNRSLHFIGVPSRKDMDQMTMLMKDMADSITELSTQLQEKKATSASRAKKSTKADSQSSVA
ncbi:phasin family protein [Aestuariicella hydrocarbonica]|uniref:Phasin family protein n=1 Tax=Pseudomaricurvus hydrocarbonicus TaxID=1470433 RepID=A0A9E5MNT2_9GAMM|nr:phasin family protein [Aestuariicella hydrocarbonica]NHO67598.1 phasin family protein [Aestuariicella hydrocarbonica]